MHEMKVTTQMKWARERSKCISKFPKAGFCNHFNRTNFQQSNESNVNECPAKSFWKRAGQRKTWSRKHFAWRIKEEREEMKETERESVELSWSFISSIDVPPFPAYLPSVFLYLYNWFRCLESHLYKCSCRSHPCYCTERSCHML